MNLTDEQKNRGYSILSTIVTLGVGRAYLSYLLAKQFNIPFRSAYRWTTIGGWSIYLASRNWNSGVIQSEKYINIAEKFGQDLKQAVEKN